MRTNETVPRIVDISDGKKRFPVIEIFGPTIQGEGVLAGVQSAFVRFGGCDYRCSWCDTPYAVIPEQVRENAKHMTAFEIAEAVRRIAPTTPWVTFSGGNPALFQLGDLVVLLAAMEYRVAVETQGSIWKDWLRMCEHVVISPKPPSSGMNTDWRMLEKFFFNLHGLQPMSSLKVVVFDRIDLEFVEHIVQKFPSWPLFLQVGNNVGKDSKDDLIERYRWLVEEVLQRPNLSHAHVLPQLHVLLWGNRRGV